MKRVTSGKKLVEMSIVHLVAALPMATLGALKDARKRLSSEFARHEVGLPYGTEFVIPDDFAESEELVGEVQELVDRAEDMLNVAKKLSFVFDEIEDREPTDG